MPLQFSQIPVPFAAGLDTKSDEYQIPVGRLSELENGVFVSGGAIALRNGYQALSRTIQGTGVEIRRAVELSTFGSDLVLFDGAHVYSYSVGASQWCDRGTCVGCSPTSHNISRSLAAKTNPDVAYSAGLACYAWEEASGIRCSVVDHVTGSVLAADTIVAAAGISPRVRVLGEVFVVFWVQGGALWRALVSPENPSMPVVSTVPVEISLTHPNYDVAVAESSLIVLTNNDTESILTTLDVTFLPIDTATIGIDANRCCSISLAGDGTPWVALGSSYYGDLTTVTYYSGGSWHASAPSYSLIAAHVGLAADLLNDSGIVVAVESTAHVLYAWRLAYTDTSGSARAVLRRGLGLTGRPICRGERILVPCATDSTLQATHYLVSDDGDILSQQSVSNGGGHRTASTLSETPQVSDDAWLCAEGRKGQLEAVSGGTIATAIGVVGTEWDFGAVNTYRTAKLGNELLIAGGVLQSYDGVTTVEHGFLQFPENLSCIAAEGELPLGDYQYSATYRWVDAQGQIHESAPAVPLSTHSDNNCRNNVTIPTLRLTKKAGVEIVVYRTQLATTGDPTFYRLTSVANDESVDSVVVTDNGDWDPITSNEILYTTGGVLENTAPPSGGLITTYKNRIWIGGGDDANVLAFSKSLNSGRPVEFSDVLSLRVDDRGGDVTSLGVMDDNLIVFKERTAIYSVNGEGPDNTGAGQGYADPSVIATDVGCANQDSIVITPSGLVFQSPKGLYRLDRTFQAVYLGAPVERYNGQTVAGASLIPTTNELRFVCSDGPALVYNYFFDQWSTFTIRGVDSVIWQGVYTYASADGYVYQETPSRWLDGSNPIRLKVTTGWLDFAGLQGFQRVNKFLLLGRWRGPHVLTIDTAVNHIEAYGPAVQIDTSSALSLMLYGHHAIYGSNSPFGGALDLEQFTLYTTTPRSEALKVRISVVGDGSGANTVQLSGLAFTVGQKRGPWRQSATKHRGA